MIRLFNYSLGHALFILSILFCICRRSLVSKFILLENEIHEALSSRQTFPQSLLNVIIAVEDKRFWEHCEVDFYSIIRAGAKTIFLNKLEGASTITQQLVRTVTQDKRILLRRKVREIILASLLQNRFSKNELLRAYCLTYDFNSIIGLHSFCKNESYDLTKLSLNEMAQITARLKYPSLIKENYIKYLKRVRIAESLSIKI